MHDHHPRPSSASERTALRRAFSVTFVLFVAEIVGGVAANSLALLSDAGHMLTDLFALGIASLAIRFATLPANRRRTFGYYRLEILSALANGILLALFAGGILWEAIRRFGDPPSVRVGILAAAASAGFLANVLSIWWLSRVRGGLGMRAALWHTMADGASSLLVLLGAVALALTGWRWIDPALSLVLAAVVVFASVRLIRDALDVLLESVPRGVDLDALERAVRGVAGVEGMHDLHVWSLTSQVHALSGHLRVDRQELARTDRILEEAKAVLERFGIAHTTLQVESESCKEVVCILDAESPREVGKGGA